MPVTDINQLNFDCESIVSMDEIPNNTYAHGVIDCENLDTYELLEIVNKTLSKSEQKEILQKSNNESTPQSSKVNLENVVEVKNLDNIKIKDITENEKVYENDSDSELDEVDCSDNVIFPPKDPQCSTSGSKSDGEQMKEKPKFSRTFKKTEKSFVIEPDYVPTKLMSSDHPNFKSIQRKGKKSLVEIGTVYPRTARVENNVFKKKNFNKIFSEELNRLVERDNQIFKNEKLYKTPFREFFNKKIAWSRNSYREPVQRSNGLGMEDPNTKFNSKAEPIVNPNSQSKAKVNHPNRRKRDKLLSLRMRGFFMDKKEETLIESYKFENYPRRDQSKGVRCPSISSKSAYSKLELHILPRLREKLAFSGKVYEDANKHVCYALEIAHSIYIPDITEDALMLWCFPKTLVGDARRWLDGLPSNSINTWEKLEEKFVQQYDPPYQAWKPTTGDPMDEAQKRGLEVSAELAEESRKNFKIMCEAAEQLKEKIRSSQ
ncbi:hypothetical protein LXL04_030786 [Taraxacum kok-saghyz]